MCPSWVRLGWLGFSPDKLVLSEDTVVHTGDARGMAPSEDAAGSLVCGVCSPLHHGGKAAWKTGSSESGWTVRFDTL